MLDVYVNGENSKVKLREQRQQRSKDRKIRRRQQLEKKNEQSFSEDEEDEELLEDLEPEDQIKKEIFEGAIVGTIEPIIVLKPEESDTDMEQYDMTKVGSSRKTKKKKAKK